MCARRFLLAIFWLTLLAVAGAFAIFQFGDRVLLENTIPKGHFAAPPADGGPDYAQADNWIARPDLPQNPSNWLPDQLASGAASPPAAIFYVHPTTYLERDRWNAALHPDPQTELRTKLFVQSQASALTSAGAVWAPRYRQAAYGSFLLRSEDAQKALDFAYRDVRAAFDQFLKEAPSDAPIIVAGHSQGALHLSRLLAERGKALKGRLVAAYVVGWPISVTADLPAMGLRPCTAPGQMACVLSWQSFAEPANASLMLDAWEGTKGPTGDKRRREDMLCVNPITGTQGGAAPPSANTGTLVPRGDFANADLVAEAVGAHCDKGLLILDGAIPPLGPYVLPGNNYHVYDFALFWGSIRADADAAARGMAAMITFAPVDFAAALPDLGKLAGLDVGTKTIGLAICDAGWSFAGPAETIRRTKFTADLTALRAFVEREAIVGLVVGLPLNLDGSDSPQTQSVRAFARNLLVLKLPILLWDERWSTQAVERAMVAADVSRAKRAAAVDKLAAAHILQGAIDALANLARPE